MHVCSKKETLLAHRSSSVAGSQSCTMKGGLSAELPLTPRATPASLSVLGKAALSSVLCFSLSASHPLGERKNTHLGFALFTFRDPNSAPSGGVYGREGASDKHSWGGDFLALLVSYSAHSPDTEDSSPMTGGGKGYFRTRWVFTLSSQVFRFEWKGER